MPTNRDSQRRSRRSFIVTAGTALSAPVAAAAATVPVPTAVDPTDPRVRLERLEAVEAIRRLNQTYVRHVNAGERDAVVGLFADPAAAAIDPAVRGLIIDAIAEEDAIEVGVDGQSATARLHRVIEAEHAIGPTCPLVEMAREQGGGVLRRRERVLFETAYVKRDGIWKFQRSMWQPEASS